MTDWKSRPFVLAAATGSPVAEHYKKARKFQAVKGEGSVEEIFDRLCEAIDKKMKKEQEF